VLIFWLAIIFISFGLFAPANTTVIVTRFVCALSISGAIFLILELDGVLLGRVPPCSARRRTGTSRG